MPVRYDQTMYLFGDIRVIRVVDLSQQFGGPTVTNAAEEVIANLHRMYDLKSPVRVIYRDSCGIWDELAVKDGKFSTFEAIGTDTFEEALKKIGIEEQLC